MSHVLPKHQPSTPEIAAPSVSEWMNRASTSMLIAPNREGDLRNTQPNRPDLDLPRAAAAASGPRPRRALVDFIRGHRRRV